MTLEALSELVEAHAFDPALRRTELPFFHVPFDELTGSQRYETAIDAALRRGQRVALVGVSGSGKTSVASTVLGPLVEGFAPLPIRVALEDPTIATEPVAFARHLVSEVARWVETGLPRQAGPASAIAATGPRHSERSQKFQIAPQWMEAKLELSYELHDVARQASPTSATQSIDQARQLLDLITYNGLIPVVFLDDTDHWLNTAWQPDEGIWTRERFFGTIPRLLAEDLGAAAVVAVHTSYVHEDSYQDASGFFDPTVTVPNLSAGDLHRVLLKRATTLLELSEPEAASMNLFDQLALDRLYLNYEEGQHNFRNGVLIPASLALTIAVEAGSHSITASHVAAAIDS
jgi:hypothetical protein